jgi:Flp pilus assembly protein TadG
MTRMPMRGANAWRSDPWRGAALFARDESGVIVPLVALMLVALIGMASLALDIPRFFDLQTQLQKGADACALAAAAELDGGADAITRAQNAMAELVGSANSSWAGVVQCQAPTFYAGLPASDVSPMGDATVDPHQARFVQVTTAPTSVNAFMPLTLFGLASNVLTTGASAVAGFSETICRSTPIFVCNGSGSNDMTNESAMKGREVSLVQPPGSSYAPGNFGFLDVGCGKSATCLEQALGADDNGTCVNVDMIDTTTGQKASAANYFNTRFGIYASDAKKADAAVYSPDVNVRDGYVPGSGQNACSNQSFGGTTTTACPYPDDSNISSSFCTGAVSYGSATIGNGNWQSNLNAYWTANYGSGNNAPSKPSASAVPTRYALYQYENTATFNGHPLLQFANKSSATGAPACSPTDAQSGRRLLYAAVVDCTQLGGGQTSVRPEGVATFFLLQPPQGSGFGTMLGEYVGYSAQNDGSGIVHVSPQLYR